MNLTRRFCVLTLIASLVAAPIARAEFGQDISRKCQRTLHHLQKERPDLETVILRSRENGRLIIILSSQDETRRVELATPHGNSFLISLLLAVIGGTAARVNYLVEGDPVHTMGATVSAVISVILAPIFLWAAGKHLGPLGDLRTHLMKQDWDDAISVVINRDLSHDRSKVIRAVRIHEAHEAPESPLFVIARNIRPDLLAVSIQAAEPHFDIIETP